MKIYHKKRLANCFSARTFRNNTIERKLVSHWLVACIPSRYLYMHAFDCMHGISQVLSISMRAAMPHSEGRQCSLTTLQKLEVQL